MSLFRRTPPATPAPAAEDVDAQTAAILLADGLLDFDTALLIRATPDQRATQLAARRALYDFADAMWDDLKCRDLDPALHDKYAGVAGFKDLAAHLVAAAEEAIDTAADDEDHDLDGAEERETARRAAFEQWLVKASLDELLAARETVNPNDVLDLAEAIDDRRGQ